MMTLDTLRYDVAAAALEHAAGTLVAGAALVN